MSCSSHKCAAWSLWSLCFVGLCGAHRFYLGDWCLGCACCLSCGVCGLGQLVDSFALSDIVDDRFAKPKQQ